MKWTYTLDKKYRALAVYISQKNVETKSTGGIRVSFGSQNVSETCVIQSGQHATENECNYYVTMENKGVMSVGQIYRTNMANISSYATYTKQYMCTDEFNPYIGDFDKIETNIFTLKAGTKIYIKGIPAESEVNEE